jgi:hypothetical protein
MLTKEGIIGRFCQIFLIVLTLIIMYLGGLKFAIVSIMFFSLGGLFEFFIMSCFYSKSEKSISKKDGIPIKLKNSFLWVHGNVEFIRKYNNTIYNFKKIGSSVCFFSYLIMLLYVAVAFALFNKFSYYGFLIYLIPVITNIYFFFQFRYFVASKKGI